MNLERMTLYHATDRKCLQSIQDSGALYGHEWLQKPANGYSLGGNLTPDKLTAIKFIKQNRAEGQWTKIEGPPKLVVLTFMFPKELIKLVGVTHIFGCLEYATIMTVDARTIPDLYFRNNDGKTFPRIKESMVEMQDRGLIRYYEAPIEEHLRGVEVVEYNYRGVHYP